MGSFGFGVFRGFRVIWGKVLVMIISSRDFVGFS